MKGFPEGTLHGGARAEEGCGAPDSQDGAWCPVLLQEDFREEAFLSRGSTHRQRETSGPSPAVCVEGGGAQETPRPGLTRQQEELVPAVLIILTSLSSSGCTSPGLFVGLNLGVVQTHPCLFSTIRGILFELRQTRSAWL